MNPAFFEWQSSSRMKTCFASFPTMRVSLLLAGLLLLISWTVPGPAGAVRDDECLCGGEDQSAEDTKPAADCVVPPFQCPCPSITYQLYVCCSSAYNLDPDKLKSAKLKKDVPLKVLIHDYKGCSNDPFNNDLRTRYFKRGEYNILSVNWEPLCRDGCYNEAVQNSQLVGSCLAQVLDGLVEHHGISTEDIHLVGMGMGAHAASACSKCVTKGRIGRITGLDPPNKGFEKTTEEISVLNSQDSIFVDVIHTNGEGQGTTARLGRVDFYVNGGTEQPGCGGGGDKEEGNGEQMEDEDKDTCSHNRAAMYYAESITSGRGFWSCPCTKKVMSRLGISKTARDGQILIMMGEEVPYSGAGPYCLQTAPKPNFAKGRCALKRYQILYEAGGIMITAMIFYSFIRFYLLRL